MIIVLNATKKWHLKIVIVINKLINKLINKQMPEKKNGFALNLIHSVTDRRCHLNKLNNFNLEMLY